MFYVVYEPVAGISTMCHSLLTLFICMLSHRFETHHHLMAFWRLIEPSIHKMLTIAKGRPLVQCLKPIDEFFLFMNYLSLGLTQRDLAHRFRIHKSTVDRIIKTWGHFLYTVLGSVNIWMSEADVQATMPDDFQEYADTHVVLNCTELRCQTTSSFQHQSEHCTFKGLIGMAPNGAVTFVSRLYAASVSNNEIVKQCGIVPLLTPTMAVMANDGFLEEDSVPCKVYTPAFLSQRAQTPEPEGADTQSVAKLRAHVECLFRRVKEYKMFSSVIPLSLAGSVNQLYTVACLLLNYESWPLVEAW